MASQRVINVSGSLLRFARSDSARDDRQDWNIPDPAGKPLDEVRAIRDAIDVGVRELIEQRIDAIRADRSAHQLRLQHVIAGLVPEFEGVRSDAEIRTCADAILSRYDDVPIRSHVVTIAHRQTRDCPRAERCEALHKIYDLIARDEIAHCRF